MPATASGSSSEGRAAARGSLARAILTGGLIGGALDITYAIVFLELFRDRPPLWTLQSVASGIQGMAAFEGGWPSGLLGLAAHFTVALGAATTYCLAAQRLAVLRRHPVLCGLLFGAAVHLFMDFVVLPLSAFPFEQRRTVEALVRGMVSIALLVGLPIGLAARRLGPPRQPLTAAAVAAAP